MSSGRHKDGNWRILDPLTWEKAQLAVLMDLCDELKRLNAAIYCHNCLYIPNILRRIEKNTTKPAKRRKAARK